MALISDKYKRLNSIYHIFSHKHHQHTCLVAADQIFLQTSTNRRLLFISISNNSFKWRFVLLASIKFLNEGKRPAVTRGNKKLTCWMANVQPSKYGIKFRLTDDRIVYSNHRWLQAPHKRNATPRFMSASFEMTFAWCGHKTQLKEQEKRTGLCHCNATTVCVKHLNHPLGALGASSPPPPTLLALWESEVIELISASWCLKHRHVIDCIIQMFWYGRGERDALRNAETGTLLPLCYSS